MNILAGGGNGHDEDSDRKLVTDSLATASRPNVTAANDVFSIGVIPCPATTRRRQWGCQLGNKPVMPR